MSMSETALHSLFSPVELCKNRKCPSELTHTPRLLKGLHPETTDRVTRTTMSVQVAEEATGKDSKKRKTIRTPVLTLARVKIFRKMNWI